MTSVTEATTAAITKDPISFTVTFSEALTGTVGTSSFTATNGTVTSVSAGANNSYTVVVQPTADLASGNVALSLVGTGLSDTLGNAMADANLSSLGAQAVEQPVAERGAVGEGVRVEGVGGAHASSPISSLLSSSGASGSGSMTSCSAQAFKGAYTVCAKRSNSPVASRSSTVG